MGGERVGEGVVLDVNVARDGGLASGGREGRAEGSAFDQFTRSPFHPSLLKSVPTLLNRVIGGEKSSVG